MIDRLRVLSEQRRYACEPENRVYERRVANALFHQFAWTVPSHKHVTSYIEKDGNGARLRRSGRVGTPTCALSCLNLFSAQRDSDTQ